MKFKSIFRLSPFYDRWVRLRNILLIFSITMMMLPGFRANAQGGEPTFSVSYNNKKLEEIFQNIEDQSSFRFILNQNFVNIKRKVSLSVKDATIQEILKKLFADTDVFYEVRNQKVILSSKENPNIADLKDIKVKGTVKEKNGEPLPGVNVVLKNTTRGTITDQNGNFSIEVPSDGVLEFSFVGYEKKEVPVKGRSKIEITLTQSVKELSNVVVVGYGTQKKADVTGSTVSVTAEDMEEQPLVSMGAAMQGQMAGVVVNSGSGQPGSGTSIRIRGIGSIESTDPLVVIDGFPVTGGLNVVDPSTIKSIDVLKDASATAIYGARGANGVIMITTKEGSEKETSFEVSSYAGVQQLSKSIEMLNAEQYARLHNDMMQNAGEPRDFDNPALLGQGTNWIDQIFRPAKVNHHSLTISGANDKSNYMVSANYLDEEGIIKGSNYERLSNQINYTTQFSDKLEFQTHSTIAYEKYIPKNQVGNAMDILPVIPVRNVEGDYAGPSSFGKYGDALNPVAAINEFEYEEDKYRLLTNASLEYSFWDHFRFKTYVGIDYSYTKKTSWTPSYQWGVKQQDEAHLWNSRDDNFTWVFDNTLTYDNTILDKHRVKVMLGTSAQEFTAQYFNGEVREFVSERTRQVDNGLEYHSLGGNAFSWSLLSGFTRIFYSFNDTYLVTLNYRYDGSSRFGENRKFGHFPSGSFAWRISNENFFSPVKPIVNNLKFRVSYGLTGNQEIGVYPWASSINTQLYYSLGNQIVSAAAPVSMGNPNVHWEAVKQFNTGFDMHMFDNRLNMVTDFYVRTTEDMLQQRPIPITTGYPGAWPYFNVGKVRNTGLELTLNGTILPGSFKWKAGVNFSANHNEVLKLYDGDPIYGGELGFNTFFTKTAEGHSVGQFYGYKTDGLFQNAQQVKEHATQVPGGTSPGDIRFQDLNDDDVINDDDRTFIGNPYPDFTYGITNNFSYKGINLRIVLQGVYGNDIVNGNRLWNAGMSAVSNQMARTLDRWQGEGTSNTIPRAVYGDPNNNTRPSDRFIEDGSYLRIKNLTLGYNLPKKWLNPWGMKQVRVYLSGENIYTFTDYSGFGPEVGSSGIDNRTYPVARTITLGAKVKF